MDDYNEKCFIKYSTEMGRINLDGCKNDTDNNCEFKIHIKEQNDNILEKSHKEKNKHKISNEQNNGNKSENSSQRNENEENTKKYRKRTIVLGIIIYFFMFFFTYDLFDGEEIFSIAIVDLLYTLGALLLIIKLYDIDI